MIESKNQDFFSQQIIERNKKFVWDRLVEQINFTISRGEKYIDEEFNSLLDIIWSPTVKFLYNGFAKRFIDNSTKNQIRVVMNAAIKFVEESIDDINKVIENSLDDYLKHDSLLRNLKNTHKNYNWMKENRKKVFKSQLKPLIELLKCEKNARNYDELSVKTFKTAEKSKRVLSEQLDLMAEGFRKVAEDVSILDTPAGHKRILRILKKGYLDMRKMLLESIDPIYEKYNPD